MNTNKSEGFPLVADRDILAAVADVLGRVKMPHIRKSAMVDFQDVFNCVSTLRYMSEANRYITYESDNPVYRVTTWSNARLARFMDFIAQDGVSDISLTEREKESLQILSSKLARSTHEQHQ